MSEGDQSLVETQPLELYGYEHIVLEESKAREELLWGLLFPCCNAAEKIELRKTKSQYAFGRSPLDSADGKNDIVIPGLKISNFHCTISWTGSEVVVTDLSSNGTWVAGQKIGRGKSRVLREGNEICMGSPIPQPSTSNDDFRWIYRHFGDSSASQKVDGFFDKYDLGKELGRGTFAAVYRCMDIHNRQWYAVKIIQREKFLQQPINERNFKREIQILTALQHEHIIRLFEVYETPETIYLVMEEIDGGELLMHITANRGLPEAEARSITLQVCQAMSYIHGQGVTHRDLKPENVLLTKDKHPIVKVADFGLAKMVGDDTFLKTMCGTPSYLAPEVVLRGSADVGYDNLVDSWSMGAICYAMLANASAFIEDEKLQIRERIAERKISWDYLIDKGVSPTCVDFISKLLAFYPEDRMSLTEALGHPWLMSSPYATPVQNANHINRWPTAETSADLGEYTNLSMMSSLATAGTPVGSDDDDVRLDPSQDFQRLRIASESIQAIRAAPPYSPNLSSSGAIRVPGLSPIEDRSQESQRSRRSMRRGQAVNNGVAREAQPNVAREVADTENDRPPAGNAHLSPESTPLSRKRKAESSSDLYNGDSSPLTSPPPEGVSDFASDSSSRESTPALSLPRRKAKTARMSVDDCSATTSSHVNPSTQNNRVGVGSGRSGVRRGGNSGSSRNPRNEDRATATPPVQEEAENHTVGAGRRQPARRSQRRGGAR